MIKIKQFVILASVLSVSLPPTAFSAEKSSEKIEKLGLAVYASYPLCKDVKAAYLQWVKESTSPGVSAEVLKQFGVRVDSDSNMTLIDTNNPSLSDVPKKARDLDGPAFPRPGFCFRENTTVVTLSSDKTQKSEIAISQFKAPVRKGGVAKYDYILSSTLALIPNQKFQVDCWAEVKKRIVGNVESGDKYNELTYTNVKSGESYTLEVTPAHNFYCQADDKTCKWQKAASLLPSALLVSGCEGEVCKLSVNKELSAPYGSWFGFGQRFLERAFFVYNFTTETHLYYVGKEGAKVLVHNAK